MRRKLKVKKLKENMQKTKQNKKEMQKTAKCPECSAEIEYLMYGENITHECRFTIDNKGLGEYGTITMENVCLNDFYYKCPECGASLFSQEPMAADFLAGSTETGGKGKNAPNNQSNCICEGRRRSNGSGKRNF